MIWAVNRQLQTGFTLIEMLIAMVISVAMATMAYRSLHSTISAETNIRQVTEQVDAIDRTWQYIEKDLLYAVERTWFEPHGDQQGGGEPRVMLGISDEGLSQRTESTIWAANQYEYLLTFIRASRDNVFNQARSNLYLVGYRLTQDDDQDNHQNNNQETKRLWRDTWSPVDGVGDPAFQQRLLLTGVRSIRLRYLPVSFQTLAENEWLDRWPPTDNASGATLLPVAVEVSIDLARMGQVTRRFAVSMAK